MPGLRFLLPLLLCCLSSFAYCQFTDDFEDLNFTANPAWSGDVTKWEVIDTLGNKRMHLERLPAAADAAYLSTPSTAICNGVWEFDVRLRFTQSTSNYAWAYIAADRANHLDPGINGYQVRIGYTNGLISLYRVVAGTATLICQSPGVVVPAATWVRIRVARTGAGVWTIDADNTAANGTAYVFQATGTDNTFDVSSYFGVGTAFTATRNQWALFDNISVTGIACPDTTKPTVISVVPTSINTATVTFSERVGLATAQNPANYSFNNGAFTASTATVVVGDTTKVTLGLSPNQFNNCGGDSVRIANVQDRAGNAMLPDTFATTYFVPGNAVWKSVVISEIMADPSPAPTCIPAFEFIEIHNRGNFPVDLNGWTIKDITGSPLVITNATHPFCPGEYRILCAPGANFTGYGTVIPVTGMSSTMLNNTGDNLGLRSSTNVLVDSVEYLDTWYQDGVKAAGGWTLELINPTDTCATASNWIASNDACGGTPGAQNSVYSTVPDLTAPAIVSATVMGAANLLVCFDESVVPAVASNPAFYSVSGGMPAPTAAIPAPPDYHCVTLLFPVPFDTGTVYTVTANGVSDCHGNSAPSSTNFMISGPAASSDVIINEIFFDPDTSATNLPNVEYVELYNRSADAFDLAGWKFRDTGSPQTLGSYILLPGAYVVLCEEADTASYTGLPYLGLPTWPSLNNTGDNLGLRDGYGSLVDSVEYTTAFYIDPNKAGGGWSVELLNPNDTCNTGANWHASLDPDGGTPGAINSVFSTVPDTDPPVVASISVMGTNSIEVCFDQGIDAATGTTTANYAVNNGLGTPVSAIMNGNSCVVLIFTLPIDTCTVYTLTANGVEDCNSNTGPTSDQFLISCPAVWRSVIINEIFFDPDTSATNLPNTEYLELYNRSASTFDLSGWLFRDSSSTKTLGSYLLNPGGYVILCIDADTANFTGLPYLGLPSWPSLNNTGDNMGLRDGYGTLVDSVQYRAPLWYHDSNKDGGGWSIELINPGDSCNVVSNWAASTDPDGGTPGAVNSILNTTPDVTAPAIVSITVTGTNSVQVCFDEGLDAATANAAANYSVNNGLGTPSSATLVVPGNTCVDLTFALPIDTGTIYTLTATGVEDCSGNNALTTGMFVVNGPAPYRAVLFNEIMADPDPVVALPDAEYLELYNRSNTAWDLNGWTLHNGGRRPMGSYVLNPGQYVILCDDADTALFAGLPYLAVPSWPGLTNSGDQLGLRDAYGNLVDTVAYSISWYQDANKDDGGWSLELVNPTDSCAQLGNWIASNDTAGGTPGAVNSVHNSSPDLTPPVLLGATALDSNLVELCFDETMDTTTLVTLSNYAIDNGMGTPIAAVVSGIGMSCVTLTLPMNIDTGTVYTVTVSNMRDCKGNLAGPMTAQFVLGGNANRYQIVINEIYPDESPVIGTLPDAEFVELFNNGPNVVSLKDWTITDRRDTGTLPAYNLFPGGHVILCSSSNVGDFAAFGDAIAVSGMPGLNNDGDSLEIYDQSGQLMDFAYYDLGWYHNPDKEDGGWSMERVDPTFACANGDNWRASVDPNGATPGDTNSVMGVFQDTIRPTIVGVLTTSRSSIRIYYSELMDGSSLTVPAHYVLDGDIGVATSATLTPGALPFSVDVTFGALMDTNVVYCLSVTDVRDCPGNLIATPNSICFGIADDVAEGDLIINEILYNPYTGGSDYVELYNKSSKIVDISDVWIGEVYPGTDSIFNGKACSATPRILLPHSYVCLTADKAHQLITYLPIDPDAILEMSSFPSYDDDEGECVIYRDSATVLDRLQYLDDWAFPNLSDKNGVSLERLDFNRITQDEHNWHSAASTALYGTPGYKNSEILVPDSQATEVWLQPETFSPDEDGFQDIIAINYHFQTPGWNVRVNAYDNKGRHVAVIQDNTLIGTDQGTFIWDGTTDGYHKADVGVYVILLEAMNPNAGEKKMFKLGCVLAGKL